MARNGPPRAPLNRERVLRAALALVDERGLEALTMRRLASELDVEAMSLYNHVANKDDLVTGILGLVAAEIDPVVTGDDWRSALRARTVAAHEAFVNRPWAARIWMSGGQPSPNRISQSDLVLRCLREAGLRPVIIYSAYHALEGYALGFALQKQQLDFSFDDEELRELVQGFLHQFPPEEYPDFAEHVHQHFDPAYADADSFEFGLDLILDGLERLRVPQRTRRVTQRPRSDAAPARGTRRAPAARRPRKRDT